MSNPAAGDFFMPRPVEFRVLGWYAVLNSLAERFIPAAQEFKQEQRAVAAMRSAGIALVQ